MNFYPVCDINHICSSTDVNWSTNQIKVNTLNREANENGFVEVGIQELRMRPGTELKIQDGKGKPLNHACQFVAAFSSKNMLISLLVDNPRKIDIRAGENYQVNVFNGKYEFSFTAGVLQINEAQFNALLSCPELIKVKFVRNHLRVVVALPATISFSGSNSPIIVNNLSSSGAGINSAKSLGNVGDKINLALQVEFEKKRVNLNLNSVIKHATEKTSDDGILTGIEFENISQNDKLALYYYVSTIAEAETLG